MDRHRTSQHVMSPATLKLGAEGATALSEIIAGTVTIPAISIIAANNSKSASAAVVGLTADHKVLIQATAWAATNESVIYSGAKGIAGGIQVTATNPSASAITTTAQGFSFFAFK